MNADLDLSWPFYRASGILPITFGVGLASAWYFTGAKRIVIVLTVQRPEAAHKNLTGRLSYAPRPLDGRMDFAYRVVRLWQIDAERLLAGELGLTPLAMLGRLPAGVGVENSMASVARRIIERLTQEASPDRAGKLLATALLLTGLRVQRKVAFKIFEGVHMMEESDTFLAIVEQGEAKGIKKSILRAGHARLGSPDPSLKSQLESINDIERLDRMMDSALNGANWQEIIETP